MSIHLIFANNSIRNTSISCDSLGIHYEVSKADGILSLRRWNPSSPEKNTFVAQWELRVFKNDQIRFGEGGEWKPMKEALYEGGFWGTDRTFTGNDGKEYRWRNSCTRLFMTEASSKEPLIEYHRHNGVNEPPYLAVADSSLLPTLDNAVTTFLIMERKRRIRQKARRNAFIAGAL